MVAQPLLCLQIAIARHLSAATSCFPATLQALQAPQTDYALTRISLSCSALSAAKSAFSLNGQKPHRCRQRTKRCQTSLSWYKCGKDNVRAIIITQF